MNLSVVVPAKAGTHNLQGFGYRYPATSLYCGVWVPAFAGTTAEREAIQAQLISFY